MATKSQERKGKWVRVVNVMEQFGGIPSKTLWAKKPRGIDSEEWLPLCVHMTDIALVAARLWDDWMPRVVQERIIQGITGVVTGYELARKVLIFLSCVHDLGKASPIFQSREGYKTPNTDRQIRRVIEGAGLPLKYNYSGLKETRHGIVSHTILIRNAIHETVAVVVGGHHGVPPNTTQLLVLPSYKQSCGFDREEWVGVQELLLNDALAIAGLSINLARSITLSRPAQVLLTGLVIMSDWIASDADKFPLLPLEEFTADSYNRFDNAMKDLRLPEPWFLEQDWDDIYGRRFEIDHIYPIQNEMLKAVIETNTPGIFVIEAPMGEGKTEAALVAAEMLAYYCGCRGVYFALPSQATSNAMFERVLKWMESFNSLNSYSVRLVHGRAEFNETFSELSFSEQVAVDDDADYAQSSAMVHDWFTGRKKCLLADFAVGTIDHLLMMGLKQKHLVMRHLGLACKVVIIDECHAYDVYMESYLLRALNWLGAYGVPVIVLSATLPRERRQAVINAYQGKRGSAKDTDLTDLDTYPLITYNDGDEVRSVPVHAATNRKKSVDLWHTCEHSLLDSLELSLANGGCAGIIVNTVRRAQKLYRDVQERFPNDDVRLLHAAFLGCDRNQNEEDLIRLLGSPNIAERPKRLIVIGTQILEQSLDLDVDILFTDLCPIDLLLQRIGRLHRHKRNRPAGLEKAMCHIMGTQWGGFDRGSEAVYGRYILMRTRSILPDSISIPDDIPELVELVYDRDTEPSIPEEFLLDYGIATQDWVDKLKERNNRAKTFQINPPLKKGSLIGWLDTSILDDSGKRAEAAVRDGVSSVEVVVIRRRSSGELALLPWIDGGRNLPNEKPDEPLAKTMASCFVRLPTLFGKEYMVDKVIDALEADMNNAGITAAWYGSHWLKGSLFLITDENLEVYLCGYQLKYDRRLGLIYEKGEV